MKLIISYSPSYYAQMSFQLCLSVSCSSFCNFCPWTQKENFCFSTSFSTCSPIWYFITGSDEARSAWIWKEIWLKFKTIPCAVMHERHFIVLPSVACGYGEGLNTVTWHSERLRGPRQHLIGLIQWRSVRATSFPPQSLSSNRRTDCRTGWLRRKWRRGRLRERQTINLPIHLVLFSNPITLLYHAILWEKTAE